MTDIRNHIALLNNDNTIFDLPADEAASVIDNAITYYAKYLAYTTANTSDSHIDDYFMISDILAQLMPLSSYYADDMTDEVFSTSLQLAFEPSLINDILYFNHYNNCALTGDTPTIISLFNQLTEEQLDDLVND